MKSLVMVMALALPATAGEEIPVLIVDGQNNHNYKAMTPFMKEQLEKTGMFKVDVSTTPSKPSEPQSLFTCPECRTEKRGKPGSGKTFSCSKCKKAIQAEEKAPAPEQVAAYKEAIAGAKEAWAAWRPDFTKYKVVVSNYNGELWPEEVRKGFETFVANGGGVYIVHAANNAFPEWKEYNLMIGLGWRDNKFGKRLIYNDAGESVVVEAGKGPGAGHGPQHEFMMQLRDTEHPIIKGLPKTWKHTADELYHGQRGPAENMKVLATAFSSKEKGGTGDHEPMLWVIPSGKGQVVTNVMGHENGKALQCVSFVTLMNRSVEWLATGKVTSAIPADFPTAEQSSVVK